MGDEPPALFLFLRYHEQVIPPRLVHSFTHAALSPDPDLAIAALMIARVEYPKLDAGPYLDRLDSLGLEARRRVAQASIPLEDLPPRTQVDRLRVDERAVEVEEEGPDHGSIVE